ncbi:RNA-binding protein 42 [Spiromyces aspiralis]|uniref:RNA-binding protein 42 n=1 Tax=Spiromyces aspiralis TaxID=68401 RepID=A0ACC1HFA5_9FUNG|nr:RNA-binding protein 42 [Spiromyces aspiralis]
MEEWPENDFRIFVGDLGPEVTDAMLNEAFSKYKSLAKVKIVKDKRSGKAKGYGFVSLLDSNDYIRAMREMNGKYVGNRPMKLRKSDWKTRNVTIKDVKRDRNLEQSFKEAKKAKRI